MLHEDYVHFIYGGKLYAVHRLTRLPYLARLQVVDGEQKVFYFDIQYDRVPEQVKSWWREYEERTCSAVNGNLESTPVGP